MLISVSNYYLFLLVSYYLSYYFLMLIAHYICFALSMYTAAYVGNYRRGPEYHEDQGEDTDLEEADTVVVKNQNLRRTRCHLLPSALAGLLLLLDHPPAGLIMLLAPPLLLPPVV